MSAKHPYISGAGSVATMVLQLRKAFPQKVSSETVKKLGLAPNNESYVINALQFVDVIDEEGNKTEQAAEIFSKHKNEDFQSAFSSQVKDAYSDLFDLHGDEAWELPKDELITFFRRSDQTSAVIGGRQANLFLTFAALSGYGELKPAKASNSGKSKSEKPQAAKPSTEKSAAKAVGEEIPRKTETVGQVDFGLSVKIEVNLPANASAEAYDSIFASIRKNLID